MVNTNLGDNKEMENAFYDTNNFEVYCFCPILKKANKKIDNNKSLIEYFFVGGFDTAKREGTIKLYKIIFGEKAWKTKIKFLQDIVITDSNFEDFNGPISSIKQSKNTGNILITCYNGYVYLFTPPNIDYYLENEIEIK